MIAYKRPAISGLLRFIGLMAILSSCLAAGGSLALKGEILEALSQVTGPYRLVMYAGVAGAIALAVLGGVVLGLLFLALAKNLDILHDIRAEIASL